MKHNYKFPFKLHFDEEGIHPLLAYNGITIVESRVDLDNTWYLIDTEHRNFSEIIGREIVFSERVKHYKGDFTKKTEMKSLKAGKNNTFVIWGIIDSVKEMLDGTYSLYLKKVGGKPEKDIQGEIDIEWETPVKKLRKGVHRLTINVSVALNKFKAYSNPDYRDLEEVADL